MCIQKSNVAALSTKSTATGVKCPRGYHYINHPAAFASLFRQPSTVFRNFALNRYPIAAVAAKNEIFFILPLILLTPKAHPAINDERESKKRYRRSSMENVICPMIVNHMVEWI